MRKSIAAKIFLVVFLVFISVGVGVVGTNIYGQGMTEKQDALYTKGGKIVTSTISNSTDEFYIILGTNTIVVSREHLESGIDLVNFINVDNISYPIQISLANNQLVVSANIENAEGSVIAKIANNNEWRIVDPDLSWDRNYNTYAFEVIADVSKDSIPNVIPVLQVVIINQNTILIGCYVSTPNKQIIATVDEELYVYPPSATINSTRAPTIFKYPSKDYPGVYLGQNKNTNIVYPTGSPFSEADSKMLLGTILAIVGIALTTVVSIFGGRWIYQERKKTRKKRSGKKN